MITVKGLYRYPIKGFSPELLESVSLLVGGGIPGDREIAVANGKWDYAADRYVPRHKIDFIALMTHPRVAALKTELNTVSNQLSVTPKDGAGATIVFDIGSESGQHRFAEYLIEFLDLDRSLMPQLIFGKRNQFTDLAPVSTDLQNAMSLINLATVRDLERVYGAKLNPLRFRANVYIDGLEPWAELSWMGQTFDIGQARAKAVMRTRRCAVTNVDPDTGKRKPPGVPQTIVQFLGHQNLGVYFDTIGSGEVRVGDELHLDDDAEPPAAPTVLNYSGVEFPLYR